MSLFDVEREQQNKAKRLSSASSVMIVVICFLILLGLLGLIVENTSLGNKPNIKQEEEEEIYWDKYYDQAGLSADEDQNQKMGDEYQEF